MRAERVVFRDKLVCEVECFDAEVRADTDVLVQTVASLVSAGTELAMYTKSHPGFNDPGNTWAKYPVFPGYSSVGIVLETGKAVQDLAPGDTICFWGRHATVQVINTTTVRCIKLPPDVDYEAFAFFHMAEISVTAAWQKSAAFGKSVLVAGMGIVGNLAAQFYALSGASHVYGVDLIDNRLAQAKACGLHETLNPSGRSFGDMLRSIGVAGVDIAVEAIGANPVIRECLSVAKPNGAVVLLGSPRTPMEVDLYHVHSKGIKLVGAHECSLTLEEKHALAPYLVTLLRNGLLKTAPLITHRLPIAKAPMVYEGLLNSKDTFTGVLFTYAR